MADRKLDAAVYSKKKKKGYFFEGAKYYRYTPGDKVDKGYPKPIKGNWKKWPTSFTKGIDAAIQRSDGKLYFFKGTQYIRHTVGKGMDNGYPKKIKGNWQKWPDSFTKGIDAAVEWNTGKMYFFKGDQYIRHTFNKGMDSGYPKKIKGNWKKFPTDYTKGVDAAIYWTNGRAYFFKGDRYIRYKPGSGVESGYPKTIDGGHWEGIFRRFSSATVKKILQAGLKGKLKSGCKFYFGDGTYYFLELEDAKKVIKQSSTDAYNYTSQKFDCDDFAWTLKADFVKDGYHNMERRYPHAVGMVWGWLPGHHAMNWMINSDMKLRFIEPQNDTITYPKASYKNIYLLIT